MTHSLAGKIALITGGSRGIGAAIAIEFAKRGAAGVAITFIANTAAADKIVKELQEYGVNAIAIKADMGDLDAPKRIVKETLEGLQIDGIDILVNNAGIAILGPFSNATPEDFATSFNVNVRGPTFMAQAVLPIIRRGGRIINVSSRGAKTPQGDPYTFYAASKAALHSVTKSLAWQFAAPLGITVNTLMPGPTETDMMEVVDPKFVEAMRQSATAEKRLGTTDDIAQIAAFIAEDGSRWINGDTFSATGGGWMP